MPQFKVIVQNNQAIKVSGAQFSAPIPLDGAFTVSAQMVVSSVSSPSGASAIFQVSDDSTDTLAPSNWTDYGSSQNVTASGNLFFEKINPTGNFLRLRFACASGSFVSSTNFVVKGPN